MANTKKFHSAFTLQTHIQPEKKYLVYHLIFWFAYFVLNVLRWGSYFDDYGYSLRSNLIEFPLHIVIVYFNINYLIPKFLPSRYIQYSIYLFSALMAIVFVRVVLTYAFVTKNIWPESYREERLFDFNYMLEVGIGEFYVVGFTMAIYLIINWVNNQKHTSELERKNFETELSFLKSQIQPHFFFNTLNSLYSLTLIKSDRAPETVLKLSELMEYVIYQGKLESVSLIKEITYIQNFIDLERLRYGNKLDLNINIEGNLDNGKIAPLILIPFVENSFKHGIHPNMDKITININFVIQENNLLFSIDNNKYPAITKRKEASGVGIDYTKRRLDLIYGNAYTLSIDDGGDNYLVKLKIPVHADAMFSSR